MSVEGLKRNEKEKSHSFRNKPVGSISDICIHSTNTIQRRKKPRYMAQPQYVCLYLQYTTVLIFNARSFQQRYMICIHCLRVTFFCNIFVYIVTRPAFIHYIPSFMYAFCIMHSPSYTAHQPLVYYRK